MKSVNIQTLFITLFTLLFPLQQSFANEFNLNDYKGKVVYLDFWASWCAPCRQSFPFMNDLKAQYSDDNLAVITINLDEKQEDAAQFLKKYPAKFDVIYDPKGLQAQKYQLKAMPTSYLFNRQGKLVGSHLGFKNKDIPKLNQAIAKLINRQ